MDIVALTESSSSSSSMRFAPAIGHGWVEVFIDASNACVVNTAESCRLGHSVLRLDALASTEECEQILLYSSVAADVQREAPVCEAGCRVANGRVRMPIATTKDLEGARSMCDTLLTRVLGFMECRLPDLHAALGFADLGRVTECMGNPRFVFSDSEPAINVYREGGRFERHQVTTSSLSHTS
jgi:hypothetical protein